MSASTAELKKQMEKAIEFLKAELSKLRAGRASVSMLDGVKVEVYGNNMNLKEVAALSTPDSRTIAIQAWDKSVIPSIEKAIMAANLGLTPINDGKLVRVNLPPLTEDRRKDYVKQIKKYGEDSKVAVRNHRRDSLETVKKNKELSEDELRRFQDEVQKTTDQFVAEIDKLVDSKSKEIMSI
jgi:ribosome recycling factor